MARTLTTSQLNILKSNPHLRTLVTFFFDTGTLYFVEDIVDVTYNGNTYVGAYGVADVDVIDTGSDLVSEGLKFIVDGARMSKAGITDPGAIFTSIMDEDYHHRKVNIDFGFKATNDPNVNFIVSAYVGRITHMNVERPFNDDAKLIITLESLEERYNDTLNRTRSDADQQSLFSGDKFFEFTVDSRLNEGKLFWGKTSTGSSITGNASGGNGGAFNPGFNFQFRSR